MPSKRGGHNKKVYWLTINCFKQFCMRSSAPLSTAIRQYYIDVENAARQFCQDVADGKIIVSARDEEWYEVRQEVVASFKSCTKALLDNAPKPTKGDFMIQQAEISRAALGVYPHEFLRTMGLKKGTSTRLYHNTLQQCIANSLLRTAKDLHERNPGKTRKDCWPEFKKITDMGFDFMKALGEHGRHLVEPPPKRQKICQ